MILLVNGFGYAQTISSAEYFFDTDPGLGNGTAISIPLPADSVSFTATINTSGLTTGDHFLFVRTKSPDGIWSLYQPQSFYIKNSITKAEYFFDIDPGVGSGTAIPVTSTLDSLLFTSTVNTAGLVSGNHFLFIRTRDEKGKWSLHQPRDFYVKNSITKAEYFFDTDPGVGNGTAISVIPTLDSVLTTSSINTSGLLPGSHFLFIRTKDEKGLWSLYQVREFFIKQSVLTAEYFFDTDPGVGNGTPLSITAAFDSVAFTKTISTSGLDEGLHFLFIRTKNEKGIWSLHQPRDFYIHVQSVAAEYFIDTDPGIGNGTPISITPNGEDTVVFSTSIITGMLPDGDHYLFFRTRDSKRIWSLYEPVLFTVGTILPVEWLDFTAQQKDENVVLNWSTASETNCLKYDIEKTTNENGFDENQFHTIGTVDGHGNTSNISNYSFTDFDTKYKGVYYYRIKQVDFNGKINYSTIKTVNLEKTFSIKIFPNPGTQFFTLDINANEADDTEVIITTESGQVIAVEKNISYPYKFGENLESGIYLIRVNTKQDSNVFKIVKTK